MPHDSITSFMEVRSPSLRSTVSILNFGPRKKSKSPRKVSRTVNGFTSVDDSRTGIGVLERGCARTALELSGPEWFIFAKITVDLPATQTAAGIHNFPAIAPE